MSDSTCNGWTNYQTWATNLWLTNDKGTYQFWRDNSLASLRDKGHDLAITEIAALLKDSVEEFNALEVNTGLYADLLSYAIQGINYHEIARSFVAAAKEEDES